MIDYTLVKFPIVGPLDTKTDSTAVERPTLTQAQNCWMDRTGSLSKRYGYADLGASLDIIGGAMPALTALGPFEDTFLGFSADYAYIHLASPNRYAPIGVGVSAQLEMTDLSALSATDVRMVDHATVGSYTLYGVGEAGNRVRWILRDNAADTLVSSETITSAAWPRVVARGNLVYLFYASTAATNLVVRIFDLTSTSTLVTSLSAAPVTVAADMDSGQPADAASNATYGVLVAYRNTTANTIKWGYVSTTGVLGTTSTFGTTVNPTCLSCAIAPNLATVGLVWAREATAPSNIYARLMSWNGSAWSLLQQSGAIDSSIVTDVSATACAFESNSTTLTLWYVDEPAGLQLHQGSYTTAAVATARAFTVYRARLAGKPFKYNTVWYAPVLVVGGGDELQSSLYVVSVDGVALTWHPISTSPIATIAENATVFASSRGNFFGQSTLVGFDSFRFGFLPRLTPGNVATSLAALRRSAASAVVMHFIPGNNHKTVQVGKSTFIGGAVLLQFDGGPNGIVESGFLRLVDPAEITVVKAGGGALTASSQYNYHVVPEYLDQHGVREQGTNFGPKVVALGVGEDEVTLTIPTQAMSLKANLMVFAVYRTVSNGTVYYRVGSVANSPTALTVSFNDILADADIVDNESFPYADGTLLDNTPPPAGHVIGLANGRLFVASPSVRGLVYASKLRGPDEPVEFNDALTIQLPDDGSDVTALAQMAGALVVFTEKNIYRVAGEGPNNNGEGQWLTPERLSVDTGCANQRSVVETPMGIMFRGTKGVYLLDSAWQVQYVGAPLEHSTGDTPPGDNAAGVLVPEKQQVRYSDSDHTHVYDYFHQQWYEWTFTWDGPSVVAGGVHYVPNSSAYYEQAGGYADAGQPFTMQVRLAPFKDPATAGGQFRARRVGVVGECVGACTLTVLTAHDFAAATVQTLTAAVTAGPFFEDWRTGLKLLAGLVLTVSDGGAATAGVRLQEIAVEIGARVPGKLMRR